MRRADIGFLEGLDENAPGFVAVAEAMGMSPDALMSFARTQLDGGAGFIDCRFDHGVTDVLSAERVPAAWKYRVSASLGDLNLMAMWHDLSGLSIADVDGAPLDVVRGIAVIVSDDLYAKRGLESELASSDVMTIRVGVPENSVPPEPGPRMAGAGIDTRIESGDDLFGAIDAVRRIADALGVRIGDAPIVIAIDDASLALGLMAMGLTVACDSGLGAGPFMRAVTGGDCVHTTQMLEAIERRRAICGLGSRVTTERLDLDTLVSIAGEGTEACIDVAQTALGLGGPDVSYASTAYGVPMVHALHGAVTVSPLFGPHSARTWMMP